MNRGASKQKSFVLFRQLRTRKNTTSRSGPSFLSLSKTNDTSTDFKATETFDQRTSRTAPQNQQFFKKKLAKKEILSVPDLFNMCYANFFPKASEITNPNGKLISACLNELQAMPNDWKQPRYDRLFKVLQSRIPVKRDEMGQNAVILESALTEQEMGLILDALTMWSVEEAAWLLTTYYKS